MDADGVDADGVDADGAADADVSSSLSSALGVGASNAVVGVAAVSSDAVCEVFFLK